MARLLFMACCLILPSLVACSVPPTSTAEPTVLHTLVPSTATAPSTTMGCSVLSAAPTAVVSQALPAISASDYVRGPAGASVTLLAYCDFQSAQCEYFNRVLDQLEKEHPNDLRIVLRPYPVPTSVVASLDKSQLSAQAAIAAGEQGKFWEMHDLLHTQYSDWSSLSVDAFQKWVTDQAKGIGLDQQQFAHDMQSPDTAAKAKSMYTAASTLGISSIPTVFINGSLQPRAALSYDGLDSTIGLLALEKKQFTTCPPFDVDATKQYTATLHTEKGDIVLELYPKQAPLAVNSFVFLARQGWYDGVTFRRVIPGFVAETGDPSNTGSGGPGYYFKNEPSTDLSFDKPGVVAMENSGPDTNGSQFFITFVPQPSLDGIYTIFGQVIQGMDVVEKLTERDPQQTPGLPPGDKILSVTVQVK